MVCMYLFIYFILLSLLLCVVLDLDFVTIHFLSLVFICLTSLLELEVWNYMSVNK